MDSILSAADVPVVGIMLSAAMLLVPMTCSLLSSKPAAMPILGMPIAEGRSGCTPGHTRPIPGKVSIEAA